MSRVILLVGFLLAVSCSSSVGVSILGAPWPMPQVFTQFRAALTINPATFTYHVPGYSCQDLEQALDRYYDLIFNIKPEDKEAGKRPRNFNVLKFRSRAGDDDVVLTVNLQSPCEHLPSFGMNESCK